VVGRLAQGAGAAGDGAVGEAGLQLQTAGDLPPGAQPGPQFQRAGEQRPVHGLRVDGVAVEVAAGGEHGGRPARLDRARVVPVRALGQQASGPGAGQPLQGGQRHAAQVAHGGQAVGRQGAAGPGADVGQGPDRQRVEEGGDRLRVVRQHPDGGGVGGLRGQGGQHPVGADADRAPHAEPGQQLDLRERAELGRAAVEVAQRAGEVQQRGVGRQRLDGRGEVGEHGEQLPVGLVAGPVQVHMGDGPGGPGRGGHPALPGLEVQSLRVAVASSPAGCRSAHGARV